MHNILKCGVPANLALAPALGALRFLSFPPISEVTICKHAVTRREHTQEGKSSKLARAGLEYQLHSHGYLVLGRCFLLPKMRRTLLTSQKCEHDINMSRGLQKPLRAAPGVLLGLQDLSSYAQLMCRRSPTRAEARHLSSQLLHQFANKTV